MIVDINEIYFPEKPQWVGEENSMNPPKTSTAIVTAVEGTSP